ncbi:MAG: acyl-CoA dehydrogenase family protein [Deltaproteobacteria bacterium]|nr:acyl-CoA dehydrogenase family protein [Deltaproteobacteria bacterium]
MVSFELSPEQSQLRELAHDFAAKEMHPHAKHYDETGEYPRPIAEKAFAAGLLNAHVPTEYGGPGMSVFEEALVAEEFGWACTGISTAMEANNLAVAPLLVGGNDEQKKQFFGQLTSECCFAAYCVTEPSAGSDVANIKTSAKKKGNDYVLNGEKMWITNASVASWFFVLAVTDPAAKHKGLTGFVVPANTPGIKVGKKEKNLGQRCSDTRGITFEEVVVPAKYRLGNEGDGFKIAMGAFDHTRPIVAAGAVGLARSAMEYAVAYSLERQTFGVPIANHQAIAFMIAEMARDIEAARLLTWKACWKIDRGERNTLEAAMAKAFAADSAMRITTDAVQVFGGYGYSTEYPVEKLMRDAKIYQIYEGTSQIQRMIIAREVIKPK